MLVRNLSGERMPSARILKWCRYPSRLTICARKADLPIPGSPRRMKYPRGFSRVNRWMESKSHWRPTKPAVFSATKRESSMIPARISGEIPDLGGRRRGIEQAAVLVAQEEHRGGPFLRLRIFQVNGHAPLDRRRVDRIARRQALVERAAEGDGGCVGDGDLHPEHRRNARHHQRRREPGEGVHASGKLGRAARIEKDQPQRGEISHQVRHHRARDAPSPGPRRPRRAETPARSPRRRCRGR